MADQVDMFHVKRSDFAADSIAVMVLLPAELAAVFPSEVKAPHMTLAHVAHGTDEQAAQARDIVKSMQADLAGHQVRLKGLGYFDNDGERPAFVSLDVSDGLAAARADLVKRLQGIGLDVSRVDEEWAPHATLAMLSPGEDFDGDVPTGEFETRDIVLSHGGEFTRFDRLSNVGGKWQALSESGDVLDEFDTEDEARERLRQIEAAKAAREDVGAPAVITEPKTMIDAMRTDAMDVGDQLGDVNGWVTYNARFSRGDNIQVYPEFGNVREYRPWDVIKDPESLAGGPGSPVELRHSDDLLNPDTVLGVARGAVITFEADDATRHTVGQFRAWDRELIESIEAPRAQGGTPDLSVAFRVKIDKRPGTDDHGNPFDQSLAKVVINSVAAEPFGRGKTTKVVSRADSDVEVYSRADMLAMVRGTTPPARPIIFDFNRDRAAVAPKKRKDQKPMNMMQALIDAHGMTVADVAQAMSLAEDEMRALIAGETEMSPDQVDAFAALLAGKMQDAEPEVDGEAAAKAAKIADLEAQLEEARADRNTAREGLKAMVSRADADTEIAEAVKVEGMRMGIETGKAIALAWRGGGSSCAPDVRKDAAGADEPVTLQDWRRKAIIASFSVDDETGSAAALARIDHAPDAAVEYVTGLEFDAATARLDAKDSKIDDVKEAVARAAGNAAEDDQRKDGEERKDRLRAANEAAKKAASGEPMGDN